MNAPANITVTSLKVVKIGNSAGLVLPKTILARLGADVGATLAATDEDGVLTLRLEKDDFAEQMAAAREVMARRKRALQELAK